mmetsp:Transcript_13902/g.21039  ORF Transcript_13902/g.21039 Transcript_13902/m.21039 type:complete len:331 (+) Transcript_13902:44-1036(+)
MSEQEKKQQQQEKTTRHMDTKAPFATKMPMTTKMSMTTKMPMMGGTTTIQKGGQQQHNIVSTIVETKKVNKKKTHTIGDWKIQSETTSIVGAERLKEYEKKLETTSLPEMLFDSYIKLTYKDLEIKFDAMGALENALLNKLKNYEGGAVESVKVSCSWDSSDIVEDRILGKKTKIEERHDNMEWTFNSIYEGDYSKSDVQTKDEEIDYELLKKPEEIEFFDDIILYEDELHDHGTCESRVKIRCMPSCFFILLRCFLRVDGVIVRIIDTRVFHKFGSKHVIKEHTFREIAIPVLAKARPMIVADPKAMRSAATLGNLVPIKFKKITKIDI